MPKSIGAKSSKYAIQVYFIATASKFAGTIYCDSEEEYNKLLDENIDDFFDEGYISSNVSNDFDIGDSDVDGINFKEDCKYYLNKLDKGGD